jgi:hypothetical protein
MVQRLTPLTLAIRLAIRPGTSYRAPRLWCGQGHGRDPSPLTGEVARQGRWGWSYGLKRWRFAFRPTPSVGYTRRFAWS